MIPPKKVKQAKKDDERDDQKKSKKGKGVKPGRTVGTGRGHNEGDRDDPDLDIDEDRLMQVKPMKNQKIDQASQEHGGSKKPVSQRPTNALTAVVGRRVEDTTGSQPHEQAKPRKPKKKDPPPPAPAPSEPGDSDTGDVISDGEDATGRRKKASFTQMLDEGQE